MIKKIIAYMVGQTNIGRLEYFLRPHLKDHLGGPFNGQSCRQRIFSDLLAHVPFRAIVETGTFRGTTTKFLSASGLPVYTVEINPRFYGYSAAHLSSLRRPIYLFLGDSPRFLRDLANSKDVPKSEVFFYLDAHWGEQVPLLEELEIIFSNWSQAVAMVDDFAVPGTEYGYDDYGSGQVLNMAFLQPLNHLGLFPFFPAADPKYETGKKQGCVVLCRASRLEKTLSGIPTLARRIDALGSSRLNR